MNNIPVLGQTILHRKALRHSLTMSECAFEAEQAVEAAVNATRQHGEMRIHCRIQEGMHSDGAVNALVNTTQGKVVWRITDTYRD